MREALETTASDEPAKKFAKRRLRRSAHRARKRLEAAVDAVTGYRKVPAGPSPFNDVHQLRLGVKDVRYRVEVFGPAIGERRAERLGVRLETAQMDLGKAVDAWVLSELADLFRRGRAIRGDDVRRDVKKFREAADRVALKRARRGIARAERALQPAYWAF